MQLKTVSYWAATGLLALAMLGSGLGDVLRAAPIVQSMQHLGFPVSLLPFLGALKILGALTILFVRHEHLRVGAYAGFVFYSLGAVAVHLGAGDPVAAALPAAGFLALTLASYGLWLARRSQLQSAAPALVPVGGG